MIRTKNIWAFVLVPAMLMIVAGQATAHPHVWVTTKTEVLYGDKGLITGLRHTWTFDEFYTAFAIQGLDKNRDGVYDRNELAGLAKENVTSLKEFDFFTFAKFGEKAHPLGEPIDYFLEYKNSILSLTFTLPLKTPVRADATPFKFDVYDPTYYIAFSFPKDDKSPVRLAAGAPADCHAIVARSETTNPEVAKLNEAYFAAQGANNNIGEQFAQQAVIACGVQ